MYSWAFNNKLTSSVLRFYYHV